MLGSRTALLPYPRARYLENHKLLTVVDKLHKLYGTTLPPIVWARSVGLEVVNELTTLKSIFMRSSGSDGVDIRPWTHPWNFLARQTEIASDIISITSALASNLGSIAAERAFPSSRQR